MEAHFVTAQGCRFVTGRESIPADIRGAFAHGLFVDALAGAPVLGEPVFAGTLGKLNGHTSIVIQYWVCWLDS